MVPRYAARVQDLEIDDFVVIKCFGLPQVHEA
jgi:hypothetical protein